MEPWGVLQVISRRVTIVVLWLPGGSLPTDTICTFIRTAIIVWFSCLRYFFSQPRDRTTTNRRKVGRKEIRGGRVGATITNGVD